ncbi:hypothetical protein GCM10010260_73750 [Streptomyces filipinensis]|uniref:Uncharacterized protein n=1 Tax=Streptomyces filipinensis TaxID=66887 RepID=A0A918MEC8_9ACTN|nr:hypothetical protein GCM10010260_73750 [Streptomyces filipinensis]
MLNGPADLGEPVAVPRHRARAASGERPGQHGKEVSRRLVACSVTVLGPAAGLRCDFRNLPLKQ